MTVLVVEDVPAMRILIQEVVGRAFSYAQVKGRVFGAGHLAEARLLMNRHWPDRVLLDVTLGLESGLDLLPEFRARNTPVWILSSESWPSSRVLPPGVTGVWVKPEEGKWADRLESVVQTLGLH